MTTSANSNGAYPRARRMRFRFGDPAPMRKHTATLVRRVLSNAELPAIPADQQVRDLLNWPRPHI
ncbi:hypothetical protein [Nocardia sp. CA-119907]|uniref:hypothetical protein n=1 Tax=Nocardia sp. CA-119907 TaxID=3239973 RepID=UPI003D96F5A9